MSIRKLYYYFFYKIYKSIQYTSAPFGEFLNNFKAGLVMIVLQLWIVFSIINYYTVITGTKVQLSISNPIIYIPLVIILGVNYYTLDYLDIWKSYNNEFDQLHKKKNIIGGWIVLAIVIIITANFIFSFYCLDQKARQEQTGPYTPEIVAKERMEDSLQKAKQIEKLKKIYGEDKK
jgi:magnesium-transporting ATPase (P-type)